MKLLVFDAGPIITLTMNNLLWLLEPLKKKYGGRFIISPAVKNEIVCRPLNTKKFKFEALQVLQYIENGTLEVGDSIMRNSAIEILELANNCFYAYSKPIRIVHLGEAETLALAIKNNSDAVAIDERTSRLLIENPMRIKRIFENKMHTKITVNNKSLKSLNSMFKNIHVIRSIELVTIAYELGLLEKYLPPAENAKETLLDAVLWGVKIDGCAASRRDIERIKKIEGV